LLAHTFVSDCAVIPVPHERAGEVPKAFVVKSSATLGVSDLEITKALVKHVEKAKSKHKWLRGGVEFIESVPRSPSGKILRRKLRDKEKETCVRRDSKL
jgi:acyl-coenzyme A synthetase/AMP-(fatty) acid ligase